MYKRKLAVRFSIVNIALITVILTIAGFICGHMIYRLVDRVAQDYARFYTMDSVDSLGLHLYKEISLVQHIAESAEVIAWFADESDTEKKAAAFQVLSLLGGVLQIDAFYFGMLNSRNEYVLAHDTVFADFAPVNAADGFINNDRWFYDAVYSVFDFSLSLDKCGSTGAYRIWTNHKVIHNGKIVGVICTAIPFDDMYAILFAHYNDKHVRGFVIDDRGIVQKDSLNPGLHENVHIFSINASDDFVAAVNRHQRNPQLFGGLRTEPEIIKLGSGDYRYLSVAPIPNTNWLIVTFYSSSALFDITSVLPPIVGIILAFMVFILINYIFIKSLVLKPLTLLTHSIPQSALDTNKVYGLHRNDEIGELAKAMLETWVQLESANRSKSSFLANMSHEIRTPMNVIFGVTEIMMQKKLPADIKDALSTIYNSCDLLLGIINDILDFSKIEAGKLDIAAKPYEIASLINDSVHLNVMLIKSKPIEFEVLIDENIPAKLIGDELRIKQILNNLLSNAFKYTDAGKVNLSISFEPVTNGAAENDIMLVVSVRDTGHGMTQEQLDKLYNEYSRFHKDNNAVSGTGLGLAITQRLIYLMDGEIHVESEKGVGSLFVVRLLQKSVNDEIIGKEVATNLQKFRMNFLRKDINSLMKRHLMPYGSVLIVDDVETNLYVASGLMKLYNLQIDTVLSGNAAVSKIMGGNVYDIVFMDHMMPGMDGIETTAEIRKLGYSKPIVALTANAVAGQADIFLQSGFDDFISKPIDVRQLNTILNTYIRDKQPPEVLEAVRNQAQPGELPDEDGPKPHDPHMVEIFVRDGRRSLVVLEGFIKEGCPYVNLRSYVINVHGLRSALANMGNTALAAVASELEEIGRNENIALIKSETPPFIKALHNYIDELTSEAEKANTAPAEENAADVALLHSKLQAAKTACDEYDKNTAEDVIRELRKTAWPQPIKDLLGEVAVHLLHGEFDEAGEVIQKAVTAS